MAFNFNTSNVTVYPITVNNGKKGKVYFNTSNVTVYLAFIYNHRSNFFHFNTSNVTVYLRMRKTELL